jgi:hypothetical protein
MCHPFTAERATQHSFTCNTAGKTKKHDQCSNVNLPLQQRVDNRHASLGAIAATLNHSFSS